MNKVKECPYYIENGWCYDCPYYGDGDEDEIVDCDYDYSDDDYPDDDDDDYSDEYLLCN